MSATMMPPPRTLQQRRDALVKANNVRYKRAALKRGLRAGTLEIADVLDKPDDWLASMPIFDLLDALPRFGPSKTAKTLGKARLGTRRLVGSLTVRERSLLLSLLP